MSLRTQLMLADALGQHTYPLLSTTEPIMLPDVADLVGAPMPIDAPAPGRRQDLTVSKRLFFYGEDATGSVVQYVLLYTTDPIA